MEALANAEPLPASELPAREDRGPGLGKEGALVADLLKLLLKIRARESNVAPRLVASSEELEMLAAGRREGLAILEGWRFEEFGRDALDLVEGRLAFAIRGGKLVMTRTELESDNEEPDRRAGAEPAGLRDDDDAELKRRAAAGRLQRRGRARRWSAGRRRAELGAEALRLSGARRLRWIRPGDDGDDGLQRRPAQRPSRRRRPGRALRLRLGERRLIRCRLQRPCCAPARGVLSRRSTISPTRAPASRSTSSRSVSPSRTRRLRLRPAATPPLSRWPSRIASPRRWRASARPGVHERGDGGIGQIAAAAEIAEQGLGEHHPARRVDRHPIAVQRHVDAALGAEIGMGGPGDVGEQAGGEAQPRAARVVVEGGRDPAVEQVAMLGEAAEPRARPRAPPRSADRARARRASSSS